MRLVYLGTPEAAVPPLQALVAAGHDVVLVVTRADKRRGRGPELSPSPVKVAAQALSIPVTTDVDAVIGTGADLGVVVAFGRIIKPPVLAAVPMVNLHFSLLPRWRGAAPVERAILAGDRETGVCVMAVEEGLDTGGVYASTRLEVGDSSAAELRSRLVAAGTTLLTETLEAGLGPAVAQIGEPTYAEKITAEDLRLDWTRPATELERIPRVGKAWTTFRGRRLLVLSARAVAEGPAPGDVEGAPGHPDGVVVGTGGGGLLLLRVQPEGKPVLDARAWRNGARPAPDERLGA
ncbi:MAG: methionyl-tRNA formyltransferase [Acidimicrobiales bacterium]